MTQEPNKSTKNSRGGGLSIRRGTKKSESSHDGIGYNSSKDTQTEDGDMPTNSLQELGDNVRDHASDPIMERKSDSYGWIRVYPPSTDPNDWHKHSFLLTTEYDEKKNPPGMSVRLKSSAVTECYERPHFIQDRHKFEEST